MKKPAPKKRASPARLKQDLSLNNKAIYNEMLNEPITKFRAVEFLNQLLSQKSDKTEIDCQPVIVFHLTITFRVYTSFPIMTVTTYIPEYTGTSNKEPVRLYVFDLPRISVILTDELFSAATLIFPGPGE